MTATFRGRVHGVVDISLLQPVWSPSTSDDAFDETSDNDSALFDTLDEIYATHSIHKALFLVESVADTHVMCAYLDSRDHSHGYFSRGPIDSAGDITLERFEAGESRALVCTMEGWWNTPEVVCRHILYDCNLVVYAGLDDGQALDVRAWLESVCTRFPSRVRSPINYLAASPALFGWNMMWNSARLSAALG